MSELTKDKRRAMRRKRNHLAREMKLSKQFHEKTVLEEKEKRPRKNLKPRDLDQLMELDDEVELR